nr:MAG TPA: hypothetical protein [Caudoviricetes sp.]
MFVLTPAAECAYNEDTEPPLGEVIPAASTPRLV